MRGEQLVAQAPPGRCPPLRAAPPQAPPRPPAIGPQPQPCLPRGPVPFPSRPPHPGRGTRDTSPQPHASSPRPLREARREPGRSTPPPPAPTWPPRPPPSLTPAPASFVRPLPHRGGPTPELTSPARHGGHQPVPPPRLARSTGRRHLESGHDKKGMPPSLCGARSTAVGGRHLWWRGRGGGEGGNKKERKRRGRDKEETERRGRESEGGSAILMQGNAQNGESLKGAAPIPASALSRRRARW